MPDMEKVMTWLEICGKNRDCSGNCPYGDGSGDYEASLCREDLMADALSLLKEQQKLNNEITQRITKMIDRDELINSWEILEIK